MQNINFSSKCLEPSSDDKKATSAGVTQKTLLKETASID